MSIFVFRLLFLAEATDKGPHCFSKVTNCKNCIDFTVFLFSPKINFFLTGITLIPDVIKINLVF